MQSKRLFLAIGVPQELHGTLLSPLKKAKRIDGVKPSIPAQLHITLRFLGEIESSLEERLVPALASIPPWRPFQLAIEGAGLLPSRRHPKILYAGIRESSELLSLKTTIDDALSKCGLPPENGTFRPHITVARIRDNVSRSVCDTLPSLFETFDSLDFTVKSFGLHSSLLLPTGAQHRLEAEFPKL
jgi:RNA 2',3'-cyclic 3'-phosphodiesterase